MIALHLQGARFAKCRASHIKNNILCLADGTEMPRKGDLLLALTVGLMTSLLLGQKSVFESHFEVNIFSPSHSTFPAGRSASDKVPDRFKIKFGKKQYWKWSK